MSMHLKPRRHGKGHSTGRSTSNRGAPRHGIHRKPRRSAIHAAFNPAAVLADNLPDLIESKNGFGWACCPFHDDRNPSLCVNVESGWYRCYSSSCGATGSNIVGFVGRLLGYSTAEARSYLESHYG
jgi:hypothetical protein